MIRIALPEPWPADEASAEAMQDRLRGTVDHASPGPQRIRTVAGLDVAYDSDSDVVVGAVTILDADTLAVFDTSVAFDRATFPYVPGLLAFRELPALVAAWNALTLTTTPDLVICDGYGYAHPRRFGLACHFGALTGLPSVGVGKTPFVGSYAPPGAARGSWSPVVEGDEVVGRALRTQDAVREVFVSVGNGIDLETACRHVLALAPRYRLPETTRTADHTCRLALAQWRSRERDELSGKWSYRASG
jgi:deoxyribonuclease V